MRLRQVVAESYPFRAGHQCFIYAPVLHLPVHHLLVPLAFLPERWVHMALYCCADASGL